MLRRAAAFLVAAIPALAHHAFAAAYDEHKLVAVSGSVAKMTWVNPHPWIYVDVKDSSGKITQWSFEMGSPNGLLHRGWTKTDLKAGDTITIDGYASRETQHVANARTVTLPGGRKLFGGFQSTPRAPK